MLDFNTDKRPDGSRPQQVDPESGLLLGHASAAMTMDLYGHLIDHSLWEAAAKIGGTTGAPDPNDGHAKAPDRDGSGA